MQNPNDREMDCNCDDDRVAMTRRRLNTLYFPTLQSIAGLTILNNFEKFADEQIQSLSEPVHQILLKQLEMVNSRFTKEYPCMYKKYQDRNGFLRAFASFRLLVGPKCTEFCLNWLMVMCPDQDKEVYICEVLKVLANKAPHLQKLVIGRNLPDEKYVYGGMPNWRSHGFGVCLLALHNLISLSLDIALLPEELLLLSQNMPKLEFLYCNFDLGRNCSTRMQTSKQMSKLQEAVSQIMINLKSLKHFIFRGFEREMSSSERSSAESMESLRFKITDFLVKNFPQLESIGDHGDVSLHRSQEMVVIPQNSQLKEITLFNGDIELRNNPCYSSLSNISTLNVSVLCSDMDEFLERIEDWDAAHWLTPDDKLLGFTKVQELIFVGIPVPESLRIYLQNYGQNLIKLKMSIAYDDFPVPSLTELIAYCPKLEELSLGVMGLSTIADLPASNFSSSTRILESLTNLHLSGRLPYSLESIFLAAPNVKKVKINYFKPNAVEMKRLSQLVKSNQICTQLSSFVALVEPNYIDSAPARVKTLGEFVKDICAFCPELTFVDLKCDLNLLKPVVTFMLIEDCCLQNCLKMMDQFFFVHRLP